MMFNVIPFLILLLTLQVNSNVKVSTEDKNSQPADSSSFCQGDHCHQESKPKSAACAPYPYPESEEGPFFLLDQPVRSDITEDKPGIPLLLTLKVTIGDGTSCSALKNASVHIWHPDALGIYSAYLGYYPLGQPGSKPITGAHSEPTDKSSFLRGIQYTNEDGEVNFKTIYPGWYLFRSLHMHFKIFFDGIPKLTGEFYFPEEITDKIAKVDPYSQNKDKRVLNKEDWQFENQMGDRSMVQLEGSVETGFKSIVPIGLMMRKRSLG